MSDLPSKRPEHSSDAEATDFDDLIDSGQCNVQASPINYSVRSLMIATALIALATVLLKYAHVFGLLAIFALVVIINLLMRRMEHPATVAIARGLWGIVMPVLCIIYDPGFLHRSWYALDQPASNFQWSALWDDPKGILLLPPILLQVIGLAVWLLVSDRLKPSPFLGGYFLFGSGLAGLVGVCLLPVSVVGLILVGLGTLGLTPFVTSVHYFRTAIAAIEGRNVNGQRPDEHLPRESTDLDNLWLICGFVFALALSLGASALGGWLQGYPFFQLIDAAKIFSPF